jgi:hypothetical protein
MLGVLVKLLLLLMVLLLLGECLWLVCRKRLLLV